MRASRRAFIVGAGVAAVGVSAPAVAQSSPEVRWKLTSAFSPPLDLMYGGAETFAQAVSDLTDGRFTIAISPAGEIASAIDAADAVAQGKGECAHTALSYSWNTDPAYVFGSG